MPDVTLIDFTGRGSQDPAWYAANVLIFTKSTRLDMTPGAFERIEQAMPNSEKVATLTEMAKTIPSSWEFVDLTFLLSGVTRACAQQITRTRSASYAMQSQRIVKMDDAVVTNPFDRDENEFGSALYVMFEDSAEAALCAYTDMVNLGASAQEARAILPMNTQCNLLAKYNLRAWIDLVRSRSSLRTQDEYATIVYQMVDRVKEQWPWVELFLADPRDVAIKDLEAIALELGVEPGAGAGWRIAKAIDLLRKA